LLEESRSIWEAVKNDLQSVLKEEDMTVGMAEELGIEKTEEQRSLNAPSCSTSWA